MSSSNNRFSVTDERLEWEEDDPSASIEAPAEGDTPTGGGTSGDGETDEVDRSERKRTFLIAGQGAVAGGLLVASVATVVILSSASGPAAPRPVGPASHPKPSSKAVLIGPTEKPHSTTPNRPHPAKHPQIPPAVRHRAHPKQKKQRHSAPPKHDKQQRHHHPTPPVRKPGHDAQEWK